ncbi:hypothetical protein [Pseudomonas sp. DC3000-4b1]|uniref:hypothetical protein n=1 Tax=unclassified Pseudomonas TaxID=196821 RepID=UPI003CF8AA19
MPLPSTTTSRILVAAARGIPLPLDLDTRLWAEKLSQSGHITLATTLGPDVATFRASLTPLGQDLLDWLER